MTLKGILSCALLSITILALQGCAAISSFFNPPTPCGPRPQSLVLPYSVGWNESANRTSSKEAAETCSRIYNPLLKKADIKGVKLGVSPNWPPISEVNAGVNWETQETFNQIVDFQQGAYYRYIEACQEREKLRQCIDDPSGVMQLKDKARREEKEFTEMIDILVRIHEAMQKPPESPREEKEQKIQEIIEIVTNFKLPDIHSENTIFSVLPDSRPALRELAKAVDALAIKTSNIEQNLGARVTLTHQMTAQVQLQVNLIEQGIQRAKDATLKAADSRCVAALLEKERHLLDQVNTLNQSGGGEGFIKVDDSKYGCMVLEMSSPMFKSCQVEFDDQKKLGAMKSRLRALIDAKNDGPFGEWDSRVEIVGYTDEQELVETCKNKYGNNLGLATQRALAFLGKFDNSSGQAPTFFLGGITSECEPCRDQSRAFNACKGKKDECAGRKGELDTCINKYKCAPLCGSSSNCLEQARKLSVRAQWCLPKAPLACEELMKGKNTPIEIQHATLKE